MEGVHGNLICSAYILSSAGNRAITGEQISECWGKVMFRESCDILPLFDEAGLVAGVKLWFQDVEISGLPNSQQL